MNSAVCPYCLHQAQRVKGLKIYPMRFDLAEKYFYLCEPCEAWVGCHPTSKKPLGRLANASLRSAKRTAHETFDRIWEEEHMTRTEAYKWLAQELDIFFVDCHIGMFDLETCQRATAICNDFHERQIPT